MGPKLLFKVLHESKTLISRSGEEGKAASPHKTSSGTHRGQPAFGVRAAFQLSLHATLCAFDRFDVVSQVTAHQFPR